MNSTEFLERERVLAKRYGLRKTDALFQMVRCGGCGTEALLRSRFARHEFTSVEAIESTVLRVIQREVPVPCSKCGRAPLDGRGSRHIFLMYSEREDAHIAFTLRMRREEDERIRVKRQLWFVPNDDVAVELDDEDDPRLDDFWKDSRIRARATHEDPEEAALALNALREVEGLTHDPYLLRELGACWLDAGQTGRALANFERSLAILPAQRNTARTAGRLHMSFGQPERGVELLREAWQDSGDDALLTDLVQVAYRARRFGTMQAFAEALLEADPDALVGYKALACAGTVEDVGAMADAWEDLGEAATTAGAKTTAAVAAFWVDALELPIPDWSGCDRAGYIALLADELSGAGWTVTRSPDPVTIRDARIPIDVEAEDESGRVVLFQVYDREWDAVAQLELTATLRACWRDERRAGASLVPLSRYPMSFAAHAYAARTPVHAMLVEAEADPTFEVKDENIAAFVVSAERLFGRSLDFEIESLEEVDAVLSQLHDDGFGEVTFAFQCHAAAYVAAVLERRFPESRWEHGTERMDPRVFALPTGEELNLVSKVGKAVRNGSEDAIAYFIGVVLDQMESA